LNTAYLGLQLLYDEAKGKSDQKQACVIKELRESNNSVLRILNDLTTYERIDEGVMQINKTMVSVMDVLNMVLASFALRVSNYK